MRACILLVVNGAPVEDLIPDGLFLIIVQVGIPSVLKVVLPAVIITLAGNSAFTKPNFWPHEWPLIGQVGLMLLTAEFSVIGFIVSHEFNGLGSFMQFTMLLISFIP